MIFLSHNYKDKPVIEQFALKLRDIFGQGNVFYDSWAIQPGDGIIDKMNSGLQTSKYFLFFVSENSLASNMVRLEWQNALIMAAGGNLKFIPIRIDSSEMPALLLQTLYIDLFSVGLESAVRQTIDVVSGKNTYSPTNTSFSNLHAKISTDGRAWTVRIEATQFMEPISSYGLFLTDDLTGFEFNLPNESAYKSGGPFSMTLSDGTNGYCKLLGLDRATTPGHPVIITIIAPKGAAVSLPILIMHQHATGEFKSLPVITVAG